ncbi:MAG: hypothetical protein LBD45_00005, partial [Bacteroidales bacterium]|nr:hypothetical protein [Bacteroidales bacterium]
GFKTLISPYLLLSALYYVYWLIFIPHPERQEQFYHLLFRPFLGVIYGTVFTTDYSELINIPLWFLPGLFCAKIIHQTALKIGGRRTVNYIFCTIFVSLLGYALKYVQTPNVFSLHSALLLMPFFALGNICRKNELIRPLNKDKINLTLSLLMGLTGFALLAVLGPFNGAANISFCYFGENILMFYLIGMVGIVSTVFITFLYTRDLRIMTILAGGSVLILGFHSPLIGVCYRIAFLLHIEMNVVLTLLASVLNIVLLIVPIILAQKYFPALIGGRKMK